MLPRIYADFNNMDEQQRVRFNTYGTKRDLENLQISLYQGMEVILYMEDLEVEAVLEFDGQWVGIPDWSTAKDIPD